MKDAIVREPGPVQVEASPITRGLPTAPEHPLDRRELSGYLFWGILGAFILTTEALAAMIVLAGLAILAVHLVFYPWPD